jgi:hypothetical protein
LGAVVIGEAVAQSYECAGTRRRDPAEEHQGLAQFGIVHVGERRSAEIKGSFESGYELVFGIVVGKFS